MAAPAWYRDAIIYQLHVKTFADANGDGLGDFDGLIERLPYLSRLGVTCVWLLPFYVSPLRDDGYDVAHYERVDPRYGSLKSFSRFVDAAHAAGIRVIVDLVLNHTSDQHPWFQASRRAPAGSAKRNFYVWSATDTKYAGARVIFRDFESSNWTWDSTADAFYWHRFFHHQPDLNFDNPHVVRAMLKVVQFWLDRGVDGFRLDAAAHVFEREGTNCENLPETHAFLKRLRSDIDGRYRDRILLAEANQAGDARPYFGDGDECHMAFHFPLMPRLFLALEQERAAPIVDIIARTAEVPAGCQWALFLRNHDELTLSAVTADEREVLLNAYAPDPRMRLNKGIRRRLAPLMGNDRARLDLAHALLLALPGTPVLYYGDEIGMGDNVALGDREGLRTPMQWSDAANGGFSRAAQDRLVSPLIDDDEFGYPTVNVERQFRDEGSLLNRIVRLVAVRRRHAVFGRGTTEFLLTDNPRVLAFVRRCEDEAIVVVANLARTNQSVTLAWPEEVRHQPLVDLIGATAPSTLDADQQTELAPFACHWFCLEQVARRALAVATDGHAALS
ncbi:MAG TPA: maltose alpha-D-glucosyltransferase [Vicinamibacterales bacterium]